MSRWSRRDILRAGLAGGSLAALPPWVAGCGAFPHRDALWHNDVWTKCIDPKKVTSPDSLGEIVEAVRGAVRGGYRIRAVGTGHSFSDVAVVDGHMLRFERLNQVLPLEASSLKEGWLDKNIVRVEAGMTVRELNNVLACRNLALPNMGGWDAQTISGVVSTATHGSGLEFGSLASIVRSMVLVTENGKVKQIERADGITDRAKWKGAVTRHGLYTSAELVQDDDVFRAALVGIGCLGVIYSMVVEVAPLYWLHEQRELSTWEQLRAPDSWLGYILAHGAPPPETTGDAKGETPRNYEILVNPFANAKGQHTCLLTKRFLRKTPPPNPCTQRGQLWLRIFTALDIDNPHLAVDAINGNPRVVGGTLDNSFQGMAGCYDAVSYQVFNAGDVNLVQAYSVEPAVALHQTVPAMDDLLRMAAQKVDSGDGANSGPISIRFVKESDAYLSPQEGRPTAMFEIQALVGVKHMDDLLRAEEDMLLQKYGARPHWGLDVEAIRDKATIARIYPKFPQWEQQFRALNSAGVFNNEFTDRVGLSDPNTAPRARKKSDDCAGR